MISLLRRIFVDNWQRKLVSLILAMIVWILINHSMTTQKTINNVSVKISNLPEGKTVKGLQGDGFLQKKLSLCLHGNKNSLEEIDENNLVIVIDASKKNEDNWDASITKKNLLSLDPTIDLSSQITKVSPKKLPIKLHKLVTEKIPVLVTQPIGEPPKGYQYLDLWPYHLTMTVTGSEEVVKQLKIQGAKLTFNLNEIPREELDKLSDLAAREEFSYFIPPKWKQILIPPLSSLPFTIDDNKANLLRIDFIKTNLIPLKRTLPIHLFYPLKYSTTLNPETISLATSGIVEKRNGIKLINMPLYAHGVSRRFVDIVKDKIQISILVAPKSERNNLLWNVEFIYPNDLEDRYVAAMLAEAKEKANTDLSIQLMEQHLRMRFRDYMNKFRLYTQKNQKLALDIQLKNGSIFVQQNRKNDHHN